ncbi:hypothetical protein SI65_07955 [Aspergillus cristatus]|uniref:Protein kinase domain-containing protein n=1 Tax=Aspergillus cristatus TaxID=573508 RepID=A0A1E3B6C5_ASPCR|nr:hypothetical protein SI65_07955 [Aspergillus cristatus]
MFAESMPKDSDSTWVYHKDRDSPDSSVESNNPGPARHPPSPSQQRRKRQQTSKSSQRASTTAGQTRAPNPEYCTQACLRGLCFQANLDPRCPNFYTHQEQSGRLELINLVSRQLNEDPDHCCQPLGKERLHGSLFAITLDTYGYTFVDKGTEYDSHYEGDIYQMLKQLQGTAIPVYLGDIYLRESVYFLGPFCEIIHMSLMAWVGESIDDKHYSRWDTEIRQTVGEVYEVGVEHLDVRSENLLWSEEMQRVMLVDFGRGKGSPEAQESGLV